MTDRLTILCGDALEQLRTLQDESVQCCVTSPPYWGLRDYGTARWEGGDADCDHLRGNASWVNGASRAAGPKQISRDQCQKCGAKRIDIQIGLEKTPEEYVANLVSVFNEVRRVLRKDGVLWLNLGDSFWTDSPVRKSAKETFSSTWDKTQTASRGGLRKSAAKHGDIKNKDLIGIPWMAAFALRSSGWYLRAGCPWIKRFEMPESATDRPTCKIETIFQLTKSAKCFYDHEAVMLPKALSTVLDARTNENGHRRERGYTGAASNGGTNLGGDNDLRFRRQSNWFLESFEGLLSSDREPLAFLANPGNYSDAHFATYPPDLIKPCILAGSKPGDVILDPFGGSGTTGMVAIELGRKAILIELNPKYVELIERRCDVTPGFAFA